jgi:chemotaxis protein MotB
MIPVLDVIADELVNLGMPLRIEGHTDENRLASGRFRDNWELSASRAAAVASYVQRAHRMDGKLLSAAGFGSTRPLAPNTTQAGREANRRVEMLVQFSPGED